MKKILLVVLFFIASNAVAGQYIYHQKLGDSWKMYSTYEATNGQLSKSQRSFYRGCKKLSAAQIAKREKLVPNKNIAFAMYCSDAYPGYEFTILLKDIRKVDDGAAIVVK